MKKLLFIILLTTILWFTPYPEGISLYGYRTTLLFLATIACIVLDVMPIGAAGLISITAFAVLRPSGAEDATQAIKIALSEFNTPLIWLIMSAFLIARGFIKTGLSRRISYYLIRILGKSTLGLAYGLSLSELLLAPALPSATARAGGIIYSVAEALSLHFNSKPTDSSRGRLGTFLMINIAHMNNITSAMFLTAYTGNLLAIKLVSSLLNITIGFGQWFILFIVPALISFIIIPLVIYWLTNPELKKIPDAPKIAAKEIKKMGKMSPKELVMAGTVVLLLALWIGANVFGLDATTTAFIGLSILLLSGVLSWEDVKAEKAAWDAVIWFSALIMLAGQVGKLGVTKWIGISIGGLISHSLVGTSWLVLLGILCLAYVYLHYFFASTNAHIAALLPVFLSVAVALGVPPLVAAAAFIISGNYFGSLTQYANGPNPLLFAAGYVPIKTWWTVGFICSLINMSILFVFGFSWWKLLGIY